MQISLMKVFYGADSLPYKDVERTVHYPIVGNAFMGASNTTKIRFYVDRIGGSAFQWVVIGKLPNGKRIFTPIESSPQEDTELGENYIEFSLTSAFTQCKGDLMLSLGGYTGMQELEDGVILEVEGSPVIEKTGAIKVNIAYSTQIAGGDNEEIQTWLQFLTALGTKANKDKVIITYQTFAAMNSDLENYNTTQYFFCEETKTIYKLDSGVMYPITTFDRIGLISRSGAFSNSSGLSEPQLEQAKKKYCLMLYTGENPREMYIKVSGVSSSETESQIKFVKLDPTIVVNESGTKWTYKYKTLVFNASNGNLMSASVDSSIETYTTSGANITFPRLSGNNTFTGANIFNDVVPEIGSGAEYTPSNLKQLASTGKLKEVSDDLSTEVSARESADALLIPLTQKGANNGVATLDNNAKIPLNQLPDSILGQLKFGGTLYIFDSDSTKAEYNLYECGVIDVDDDLKKAANLTTSSSITVNGISAYGSPGSFVSYADYLNADITKVKGFFFIVSNIHTANGYISSNNITIINKTLTLQAPNSISYILTTNVSTGDWLIQGSAFSKYFKIDNTDAVMSVNGRTGAIVLSASDVGLEYIETDIAPLYDNTATYEVNDLVIYNGKLYKCITAISVAESFDSSKWLETNVKNLLKTLPQYVDITILTTDWNNNSVSKTTGVTDLGEYDIVLCLPNGYENDAYVRAFGVELSSFDNATGVATFSCMTTPTETIHITLQILRR